MIRASRHGKHIAASIAVMLLSTGVQARAAGCSFEALGEGHVAAVIDARTFRLDDGREVRLAGILLSPTGPGRWQRCRRLSADAM